MQHRSSTKRAPFGGDRRWGVPGRRGGGGRERRNGKALAIAALALVMTAGLLGAQLGGWTGALSGDGEAAVPDAWPPSGDAAFAGLLPGYAFAQSVALNLTAAGSIADTGTLKLDGASGITTFESGGSTYAAVASFTDSGVQILDITDPSAVTAAGSITDTGALELGGAGDIAIFESGGSTYAAVAAYLDDGVQILDVTDPSAVTAAGSITDTGALELGGTVGIAIFESGGSTYAAVAAYSDDGVQILNMTDPSDVTAAGSIADTGTLKLDGARGIATFESGGSTYAAVAAYLDDGVQILDITDPSAVTAAGSIADTGTLKLNGASGITTFESGGSTYAAVAAYLDDGVQILDITDPSAVTAAGSIVDTGTLKLNGASGITTFESGGSTYAAVASHDDGVQILDITDPSAVTAAGSITDGDTLELDGARGIATFESGGSTYAAVAAYLDDGVQILRLTNSPPEVGAGADQEVAEGATVTLSGTATDDDPADILTYSWTHDGTLAITFADPAALSTTFTAPDVAADTTVTVTLTANDGTVDASDTLQVTITDSPNSPPEVEAGADQEVAEGATVSLDGTVTDDDTEDTLDYTWSHNSTALTITFADSKAVDTTFDAPNVSEDTAVEFTLTVSDGTIEVTDKAVVTITDSANSPPEVEAGADQEVAEGATVSLSGTATDDDPEDTLTYEWTHDGPSGITFANSAALSTTFTAPDVAADTTVTVTLTANDGTVDVSDTLQVTITDSPNSPPEVEAGADQEVAEGATVSLSGTATDADPEDDLTYSWTHDGPSGITFADPAALSTTFTAPDVAADTTVTVTLTANDGTVDVSDALQVTITDSPSIPPAADAGLNLTATDGITDGGALKLNGAKGITTFESGGSTYAAVASSVDDGVQILNVTDPSAVTAAGSIGDTGALELDGARGIAIFESGGSTYAAVAAYFDDGVQILNITDPSAVTAAGSIGDTGALELDGAEGIAIFESGGSTYAAVAAFGDGGVQILNITDPSDVTAAGSIGDTAALELDGAEGIAIFESGGSTYAAVAAYYDGGVQILNVTDPSDVTAAGSIGDTAALELEGARGIAIFESGGSTYAAVAAEGDDGVQILNVTDPSDVTAAGSITDGGALELDGARGIATFASGGGTYAAVASSVDDGVQILNVTDPSDVTAAGSITDGGALELDGARGIATFASGGGTYAAVAAYYDGGVQILRLTNPPPAANTPPTVEAGPDQTVDEGDTVTLSGTVSDDDPEDDLTYSWTHDGTLAITFADPAALSTSFTAPDVAANTTVTVTLTANDGTVGVSDTLQVTITDSPNSPPTVNAGQDQEVAEGATVSLSGTATDADPGDTLTYSWTHDSTLTITFADPAALSTSFTAPDVAADTTVTVTLTANDGTVDASDTLQVTITDSPNSPPTVNAGQDQEVAEGATVSLSGTATDADPEDDLTYSWTHDGALTITFADPAALSTSFTAPDVAADTTFTVTLTANDGTVDVSDALQVTITDSPNSPPTVNAGQDQEVAEGATVSLSGTATDADPEDDLTYSWTHDGALTIAITGSDSLAASFTAPDVAADTTVTVTLTANDGTVDVSDALQVTITDSPSIPPAADAGLNLTATDGITTTTALELDGARGIAIFESGGSTYAAVASYSDDGVQILNVTDPSAVTAAGSITDTAALELGGTVGIAIFESGGSTYAAVAAYSDDGVQILNITDPSAVTAAGSITDTAALELDGAEGIAIFESGGSTYAAVAAYSDDGVQILNITDPSAVTAAGSITDTAALELDGAGDIAIFESGGSTYAAVAAYSDGVQILNITDPSAVTAAGSITDTAALELDDAEGIAIFESGGSTYAAVAAFGDDGVQILNITDPSDVTAAGSITDTAALELDGAGDIAIFESGGSTYAAVTAYSDDGVQILNVTDPSDVTAAGSITDDGALELDGAGDIAIFESGGSTYAAVTAYLDDGVQILRLTNPTPAANSPPEVEAGADQEVAEGATVSLSGTATDDDPEDTLTYEWTHDGALTIAITGSDSLSASFTAPDVAANTTVTVTLTANDGTVDASDTLQVTITDSPNSPPEVEAGADQEVAEGATVSLDGTVTDDDTEDTLDYTWSHNSTALTITFADSKAVDTTFDAPNVSEDTAVEFTLTVSDGTIEVTDKAVVTITDSANSPPEVEAGADQEVAEGATVSLSGTATDADPEDDLTYEWTHDGPSGITFANSAALSTTFTAPDVAADTTVTVTLTANDGTVDASDTLQVTITDSPNSPPEVEAGADQEVAEGATVSLSGTATDADPEDDLTYSWTHDGPSGITFADPAALSTSFTAPDVAADTTFTVTLTANDGTVDASDTLQVTITDSPNSPPEVEAGADQEVAEGATVSLSGTATDADPEDDLTYEWTHDGPSGITFADPAALSTTFTAPDVAADTTFTVTLTANDGTVDASDTLQVTITDSPNSPPEVEAGADQEVAEGATVALSGTATDADPEDDLTYEWTHDGPSGITFADPAALSTTFTAPDVAANTTFTVTLTANDGTVDASDTLQVTITDSPNSPPEVEAGADQEVAEGATVSLSGTATDADPEDDLTYEWTHDSTLTITFADPAALSTTFTAPDVAANTTFTVTLTANDGTVDASDTLQVTITDSPNSPPEVEAGADQEVAEGATVALSGTATDADPGDTLTYSWTHDSTLTITFADPAALSTSFTAPDVAADTTFTVTLTANDGTVDASDTLQVTITDSPNSPPEVEAGADQEVAEGATVALSGTATDADPEDTLTYSWTHDGPSGITFADPAALSTTFTAPDVAADTTFTVTLTANDGTVDASDTLQVTITDSPNSPPTVNAGQDQEVAEGATVSLSGTATDADPEDDLTYEWTHDGTIRSRSRTRPRCRPRLRRQTSRRTPPFTVTLTANDGTVDASDTLQVTITDSPNSPPEVEAGADQEVAEGATVALSGTATDADPGDTLTYEWTHDGPSGITFADPAALSTTFTAPDVAADTTFTVTLTANDGTVDASDTLQVTITDSPNSPPTVNAGQDQEVAEGATVSLSGTATDADPGDTLTYEWTHDGPSGITFADPAALSTTFTAPDVAADTTFTVTLTANDGTVDASDTLQVTITDSPNSPPTVNAGQDQEVAEGATVSLSGTATDADPGDTLTYEWTHDGPSGITFADPAALSTTFTAPDVAADTTFTVTLTANDGTVDASDTLQVTITDSPNSPPTVNAGQDQEVAEGATVALSGTATDADPEDTLTYSWTHDSTLTITFADPAALSTSFTAPDVAANTTITVTLTVNDGTVGVSDALQVTIADSPNRPPTADAGEDQFITKWKTTDDGESITIPVGGTTGSYTVDWGDGTTTTQSGDATHEYATAGTYTVSISDDFTRINLANDRTNAAKLLSIEQWGTIQWDTMREAFYRASNMAYNATDTPNLSGVTDMYRMFFGATSFNGDINSWDVSSVEDMSLMFFSATSFNQPLNSWDVSSVDKMISMFYGATSFNQPLNSWNVSSVTDMSHMFNGATSFNGDINSWDVSSVEDMANMFNGATSFNQSLNSWDVSSVTDMGSMFSYATTFNQSLNSWNVSSVDEMISMFNGATSFNGDINSWDVSSVEDMSVMFNVATSFNQDLNSWDVSSVTDMYRMFYYATSFNQSLNSWNVSSVTRTGAMFHGATSFNGDISGWDVASVTDMSHMFNGATSFNGDITGWDVQPTTDTYRIFHGATAFTYNPPWL